MNYIIDANLSPQVVGVLQAAGHRASHVGDHGLLTATDDEIFDWAAENNAVVITADSDFAMLLATVNDAFGCVASRRRRSATGCPRQASRR